MKLRKKNKKQQYLIRLYEINFQKEQHLNTYFKYFYFLCFFFVFEVIKYETCSVNFVLFFIFQK